MTSKMLAIGMALLAGPACAMDLKSHDVADGARLSTQQVYTECNGDNVSPTLFWIGAPAETKSFAVTLYDPDAGPHGWWHWIVFDIPSNVTTLARDAGAEGGAGLPRLANQADNDYSLKAYSGACPPPGSGVHHYQFTVWAMDSEFLPFDATASGITIGPYLKKHALAQVTLTAVYQR